MQSWPRRPRQVYSLDTHIQVLGEGTGLHHLLVQPGIIFPPKKDVLTDSSKLYPRLLCGQTKPMLQVTNIHSPTLSASTPEADEKSNKGDLLADQNGLQTGIALDSPCLPWRGGTRQKGVFRLLT